MFFIFTLHIFFFFWKNISIWSIIILDKNIEKNFVRNFFFTPRVSSVRHNYQDGNEQSFISSSSSSQKFVASLISPPFHFSVLDWQLIASRTFMVVLHSGLEMKKKILSLSCVPELEWLRELNQAARTASIGEDFCLSNSKKIKWS